MQVFFKDSCRYNLLFYVGGFSTVAYPKQYLNTDWKVQFSDMYNPTTKSSANLLYRRYQIQFVVQTWAA